MAAVVETHIICDSRESGLCENTCDSSVDDRLLSATYHRSLFATKNTFNKSFKGQWVFHGGKDYCYNCWMKKNNLSHE